VTNEDYAILEKLAPRLSEIPNVGVLSPVRDGERTIFPRAKSLPRWRWDLNKPGRRRFDLLVAANVFMYSPDPARWLRHVLASCKYFLLLDLVRRKRGADGEFGPDGDCMRFAIADARPRVEHHFDLNRLGDRLLGHHTFEGGANVYDRSPLHVVALFRGDLADPVLRIDDYPTGVRPILSDLSPLHDILHKVDARGLKYYLGIVPALVTEEMFRFLRGLRHMIPAVHGYDHAYHKYAPRLLAKGDPFNERGSVKVFNEFRDQPYPVILTKLRDGRHLLEDRLGKPVQAYIPPCNIGDRRTARALVEAGYLVYLSEKHLPGCPLLWIRSDFYGRSTGYDDTRQPDIVALHVTWEHDLIRNGSAHELDRLLDHLTARKEAERRRGDRLGGSVASGGIDH
jgi:hypothetical protein